MQQGQTAAWKRTRAWSARAVIRSGASNRRELAQHVWQPPGRHHWHTLGEGDYLAPGDLGAVDGHDRHHHHVGVGQDQGGPVGLEGHFLQGRGEGVAAMPQPPGGVQLEAAPIVLGVDHEHPTGADHKWSMLPGYLGWTGCEGPPIRAALTA
jgi:hypothetical protein